MRAPSYPFSAVSGQEQAKLALLLAAVDPLIGGVLLRGEKGTAKSTLARGIASLLPETDGRRASFRTLPLNATEDRVIGGIDFEASIAEGRACLRHGLLAEVDGGVLYIDEVNLLDDHLSDLLLDAAATGVLRIERDGFSLAEPTGFVLVGTMNPEEGHVRPQLMDRFGLCVKVQAERGPGVRKLVVRHRLEFEHDPWEFERRWSAAENQLRDMIAFARERLKDVVLPDIMLQEIAEMARDNHADGQRAEIVMARAARARAAFERRRVVSRDDVLAVAPLALAHRYRPERPVQQEEPPPPRQEPERQKPQPQTPELPPVPPPSTQHPPTAPAPERVFAIGERFRVRPFEGVKTKRPMPGSGRRTKGRTANRSGRVARSEYVEEVTDLAFSDTLRSAAPHQRTRRGGTRRQENEAGSRAIHRPSSERHDGTERAINCPTTNAASSPAILIERRDLRQNVREGRRANLLVFCVDASGSMAAAKRMEAVKGAVFSLLIDAYQKRDRVALVAFRGKGADVLLPPTSSVERANRHLAELPTGGRTPLSAGLLRAFDLAKSAGRRDSRLSPLVVILSDGRANVPFEPGADPDEEIARAAMACRRGFHGRCFVVDSEPGGRFRLGRAERLAEALGAECVRLEALRAEPMTRWLQQEVLCQQGPAATYPLFRSA